MSGRPRSAWTTLGAAVGTVVATAFLLNPTMGLFELIPDVLPIVGNLDEAAATGLLLYCLKLLFGRRAPAEDAS